jgi:Tol biopolymer transport system component
MKTLIGMLLLAVLVGCETGPRQLLPYVMADEAGGLDLYLYDLESGGSTVLQRTPLIAEVDPVVDFAGQRVAYIARNTSAGQGIFTLRIHDLTTGQTRDAVTSPDPLFSPAFSNDGEELAYVVKRDGKLQIDIKDLTTDRDPKTLGFGSDPSWRQDDRAIFYNARDTADAPAGDLMVYDLKTGINQSLALRGNGFANLPRGTSIAYTALPYSRRNEAVWLIDANSRQKRLSSPGKTHRDADPVHINGTKFVAFTRTDVATNKSSIYVVERYAKDPVETQLFEAKGNAYTKGGKGK